MTDDMRSIWSTLERLAVIFGMLGLAFTAGMNWHRMDGNEVAIKDQAAQMEKIRIDYVRKDVLAEQMKNFTDKLDEVRKELARRADAPPTPQFGRK